MREFLKKLSHAIAKVHAGMMYGKTKTVEIKPFALILVRVTVQAKKPPTAIAITQERKATTIVFTNGS